MSIPCHLLLHPSSDSIGKTQKKVDVIFITNTLSNNIKLLLDKINPSLCRVLPLKREEKINHIQYNIIIRLENILK